MIFVGSAIAQVVNAIFANRREAIWGEGTATCASVQGYTILHHISLGSA